MAMILVELVSQYLSFKCDCMSISIKRYSDDLKSAWDGLVSEYPMGLFFFQRDYIDLNKSVDEYSVMVYWEESLVAVFPAMLEG